MKLFLQEKKRPMKTWTMTISRAYSRHFIFQQNLIIIWKLQCTLSLSLKTYILCKIGLTIRVLTIVTKLIIVIVWWIRVSLIIILAMVVVLVATLVCSVVWGIIGTLGVKILLVVVLNVSNVLIGILTAVFLVFSILVSIGVLIVVLREIMIVTLVIAFTVVSTVAWGWMKTCLIKILITPMSSVFPIIRFVVIWFTVLFPKLIAFVFIKITALLFLIFNRANITIACHGFAIFSIFCPFFIQSKTKIQTHCSKEFYWL